MSLYVGAVTALMEILGTNAYIGMRYNVEYSWVDQTEVTYVNWQAGEPSSDSVSRFLLFVLSVHNI